MKKVLCLSAAAMVALALAAPSYAQEIGVQFLSTSGGTAIPTDDTAGVVSQQNFNVINPGEVDAGLVDNTGASTAATISDSYGGYFSGGAGEFSSTTDPGDSDLGSSELYNSTLSNSGSIQVSGITFAKYDLYVYGFSDNTAGTPNAINTYELTTGVVAAGAFVGTGTPQYLSLGTGGGPGFVQSTNTFNASSAAGASSVPDANYVEFTGLTASDFQLLVGSYNGYNATINGFQIVQDLSVSPEPSTWVMLGMGLMSILLFVRRRSSTI